MITVPAADFRGEPARVTLRRHKTAVEQDSSIHSHIETIMGSYSHASSISPNGQQVPGTNRSCAGSAPLGRDALHCHSVHDCLSLQLASCCCHALHLAGLHGPPEIPSEIRSHLLFPHPTASSSKYDRCRGVSQNFAPSVKAPMG